MKQGWEPEPRLDDLLALGAPSAGLEEVQALAGLERRLFGRQTQPITFSRYVLLDRIGSGAAGVVFRAYDPELERQVAIKLMRGEAGAVGPEQTRLLREAQALARLNHPNVVAVFDVGRYDEEDWDRGRAGAGEPADLEVPRQGVFMVMELVRGQNLAQWRTHETPSFSRVLEIYVMAGRGLAAAHEAGLVHRDFKPSNALLGDDGRVRVVDFGLVREASASEGAGERTPVAPAEGANTDSPDKSALTQGIVGTPAYMAPEQHRGERAGPRGDQYAFALALCEALTGRRPFSGQRNADERASGSWRRRRKASSQAGNDEPNSLGAAKERGPQGETEGLPAWLEPLLARALQAEVSARYEGLDGLLDAIERGRARGQRRRRAAVVALPAVALLTVAAWGLSRSPQDDCETSTRAQAEQIWGGAAADSVREAFAQSGYADGAHVYEGVAQRMEAWKGRWRGASLELCERELGQSQRAASAHARACLERRLREAHTLVALWGAADADLVRNAPLSAAELSRPEYCAGEGLAALVPRTALEQQNIDAARLGLAEARALGVAGKHAEAMDRVEAVAGRDLLDAALQAELAMVRARVAESRGDLAGAERNLLRAIWSAESGHEDDLASDAWLRLVWIVGVEGQRVEEGERWASFAEVALARVGADPLGRARLDHNRAGMAMVRGELDEALQGYRRALGAQREALGEDHPTVARTLNHIANVLIDQHEFESAAQYAERARVIRARAFGPGHPLVASALSNRALAELKSGRVGDASRSSDAALAITRGSGTPEERIAWHVRAQTLEAMGQDPSAAKARARDLDASHARGEGSHLRER